MRAALAGVPPLPPPRPEQNITETVRINGAKSDQNKTQVEETFVVTSESLNG